MTETIETYPATISQPPATVNSNRVLAWAELRHWRGNYPGGMVLTVSNPEYRDPEYAVWLAYTKDGGLTWCATSGHYTSDHADAWQNFLGRCTGVLATTF